MLGSPLRLAALATAALPGLDVVDARPLHGADDSALVIDATGARWVVRAPTGAAAGAALEAEVELLAALALRVDEAVLPFEVPRPAGFAPLLEGGRALVHPQLPGRPLRLETLGPGPGMAAELGRAIAAVHELPTGVVENAGLPVYDAESYRKRRLAEVDEAARTGHVPPAVLRRWERALEDVAMWRFRPTVVHGDLTAEHVLTTDGRVTAIFGWGEAKVADPADDLAWLLVAAPPESIDSILEAYALRRREHRDDHLVDRAQLAGELAVARWLLYGVRTGSQEIVDDAIDMLRDLDVSEHAGPGDAPGDAQEGAQPDAATGTHG